MTTQVYTETVGTRRLTVDRIDNGAETTLYEGHVVDGPIVGPPVTRTRLVQVVTRLQFMTYAAA